MVRYSGSRYDASRIYVGLDVHVRHWQVTVRTIDAEQWRGRIPGDWESLRKILERYRDRAIAVVYEAGYCGFWLHDEIVAWGGDCIVTPPSLIPSESGNRVKTDRIDSARLALLLSRGLLKTVWVPKEPVRRERQVLRRRRQLVRERVRVQCQIKSELRCFGVPLPWSRGSWSQAFVEWLWRWQLGDRWQTESFRRLLTLYEQLGALVKAQTELLKKLAETERYQSQVAILTSVPGIGLLTAMEILLELGDIRRFANGRKLAAYVGLTPGQDSSGEKVRLGSITKAGHPQLRASLIEASWVLISKDAGLRQCYQQLRSRCGGKRAIVAIARKLLLIVRRLWLDQRPYQTAA